MFTERTHLADAPALVVRPDGEPRGVVLFLHGLGASKEANEAELYRFAERGFVGVGIDAPSHGERVDDRLHPLNALSGGEREAGFLSLVTRAADEVPSLVRAAKERFSMPEAAIGLCGVSFGGFTAYASLLREPRPAAIAALIASPQWRIDSRESPHHHPERFFPTAVLSITAERDELVDTWSTRAFHEVLAPHYLQAPERLCYVELPGAVHYMAQEDWDRSQALAAEWFERFLSRA